MLTPLIMLGLLVLPYVLLRPVAALRDRPALRGCVGLALVLGFTGIGHFVTPEAMAEMMPPVVPQRLALVYGSGVIEIGLGVALLAPATRVAAGWAIIAMLVLLLPVNVHAAIERVPMGGHAWGPVYLLIRVPLQMILIAWCYWFAIRRSCTAAEESVP